MSEKWSDEHWQGVVGHLLQCQKKISECPTCQEIERHTVSKPERTILAPFPIDKTDEWEARNDKQAKG